MLMSVLKSDEKLLSFASLISPSKIIFLRSNIKHLTLFCQQMKHLKGRQKYSTVHRIFNSLLGVSSGDETLRLKLDVLHESFKQTKQRGHSQGKVPGVQKQSPFF